jgi:hypothetical protein
MGAKVKRIFRWVAGARLPGEGMHPLSNPTHHRITQSAIVALPAQDREFLAPEADLLIWTYCGFPDMNWHWYGTFAEDPSIPFDRRLPDIRREWEISRYCAWNSLTREGRWYPHWPPDALDATADHFCRAVKALAEGGYHDALRILGAAVHYAEDCGSPAHAGHIDPPLHLPMERIDRPEMQAAIAIAGYTPRLLGSALDTACDGIRERGQQVVAVAEAAAGKIRKLCEAGDQHEAQSVMVPCAQECARYVADLLHTFCVLGGHAGPETPIAPYGCNLIANADLAEGDDVPQVPRGWYIHWNDLGDRNGRAGLVASDQGPALMVEAPPGQGIHWRTSWPRAVRVRLGMRLHLALRYRTEGPQGSNRCSLRFYTGNTTLVGLFCTDLLHPAEEWCDVGLSADVPEGASWARVSLDASGGSGRILFRDPRLVRLTP